MRSQRALSRLTFWPEVDAPPGSIFLSCAFLGFNLQSSERFLMFGLLSLGGASERLPVDRTERGRQERSIAVPRSQKAAPLVVEFFSPFHSRYLSFRYFGWTCQKDMVGAVIDFQQSGAAETKIGFTSVRVPFIQKDGFRAGRPWTICPSMLPVRSRQLF